MNTYIVNKCVEIASSLKSGKRTVISGSKYTMHILEAKKHDWNECGSILIESRK